MAGPGSSSSVPRADWVGEAPFLLEPRDDAITGHVRACMTLQADDTPVPVLDPGVAGPRPAPCGSWSEGEALGRVGAASSRRLPLLARCKGEHARTLLGGCRGFLHADGYAGLGGLYEPEPVAVWCDEAVFVEGDGWRVFLRRAPL